MGKWTQVEDGILIQCVYQHDNKDKAFVAASKLLTNRTYGACNNRWYTVLQYRPKSFTLKQKQPQKIMSDISKLKKAEIVEKYNNLIEVVKDAVEFAADNYMDHCSEAEDHANALCKAADIELPKREYCLDLTILLPYGTDTNPLISDISVSISGKKVEVQDLVDFNEI